jgi:hypothetical protein
MAFAVIPLTVTVLQKPFSSMGGASGEGRGGNSAGAATDNPVFLQRREQIIEGMRKAGIPED